jgi:hypothetical protein
MALAANRAACKYVVGSDAQERVEFTVDPDVDILTGVGAGKMQPFHGGLRKVQASGLHFLYRSSVAEIG